MKKIARSPVSFPERRRTLWFDVLRKSQIGFGEFIKFISDGFERIFEFSDPRRIWCRVPRASREEWKKEETRVLKVSTWADFWIQ